MQSASTFIIIIPMIFGSLGTQRSIFLADLKSVAFVSQPIQYLLEIMSSKPGKYKMVLYFLEVSDPNFPFFSTLTKFQQYMFKRFRWILESPEGQTKILVCRYLTLEVLSALIEYENRKAKPAHYLIQIVDCNDPNDQRQN